MVNALSDEFEITSFRDAEDFKHSITFREGEKVKDVTNKLNGLFFDDRANATIYSVNVKECPEVASEFTVFSVPSLVFIKDGEVYHRHHGTITKEQVLELINK